VTHDELQQLLGAYAVDAVDAEEAGAVAEHLATCPACRAEVSDLREVAGLLSNTGADAPPAVWDRISASLSEPQPPLRFASARRARQWTPRLAVLAAAAVIVVFGVAVMRLNGDLDHLRNQQNAGAVAAAASDALARHDSRIARLTGADGSSAVAVVRADGRGYFLGASLPALDHHVYQLWAASPAGTISSLGTVPGPGTYAFAADPSAKQIMVTIEQAPVARPTGTPVLTGVLT